jgi:phosphatidylserine decarboxylase
VWAACLAYNTGFIACEQPVSDFLRVLPQYLLPKLLLTRLAGHFASGQYGSLSTHAIRHFVKRYRVDMAEAAEPDISRYPSFNEFFTRALKPGIRPLADAELVCPVDGAISQFGHIDRDQIFQAKGHHYSTRALVGGDAQLATQFAQGDFATIYLSPRDYHRIHMPCDGRLQRMIYVPGSLFSVNPLTARTVPGLFARNERVVCVFESEHGPFVLALVGATIVGSMATVWHGQVNPPHHPTLQEWDYRSQHITLKKGDEMGRFMLGSTVVLLFPGQARHFNPVWQTGQAVKLGEAMAHTTSPTAS